MSFGEVLKLCHTNDSDLMSRHRHGNIYKETTELCYITGGNVMKTSLDKVQTERVRTGLEVRPMRGTPPITHTTDIT